MPTSPISARPEHSVLQATAASFPAAALLTVASIPAPALLNISAGVLTEKRLVQLLGDQIGLGHVDLRRGNQRSAGKAD